MQTATAADALPAELTVASSNNFPPINMLDDDGRLSGFGRDLSDAVMADLGIKVKRRHSAIWTDVLGWLDRGEIDLIHDTGYTTERDKYLDYTVPIIEMPEMIFVKNGRFDINTLNSLHGKTVACVNKHITHLYLQNFPEIKCHIVNKPIEGLYALVGGTVDAFVYPREIVMYFAQKLRVSGEIKMVGEPLRVLSWSMTVREGNTRLLEILNKGITHVRETGEYQKIYNKWFGQRLLAGYTRTEVAIIVIAVVVISLFLGTSIVLLIYNRRLKSTKDALEQSEKKYTEVAANIPGAVFQISKRDKQDCQLAFISQGMARTIGVPATKLLGELSAITAYIHQDDRSRFHDSLMNSISAGTAWQSEFRIITQQNETLWFRASSQPTRFADDNIIYNGILLNISDFKELQQQQYHFFELTNHLLCVAGFDGYFKLLNPTWSTVLGFSLQELYTIPFVDFVHPDDRDKTIAETAKLAERNGTTIGFENRYLCQNGEYRYLSWMAVSSPYTDEIFAAANDITALKKAEAQLQHSNELLEERVLQRTTELQLSNEKLQLEIEQRRRIENAMQAAKEEAERANMAKSEFLSRMSHELRTPLNAILGFAQLLESTKDIPHTEVIEYANEIYKAGDHLHKLINEVLDLSRIEAGRLDISMQSIDLGVLIQDCLAFIKPMADAGSVTLTVSPANESVYVHADVLRLKQIFLNLMSNAVKYNRPGGNVSIEYTLCDKNRVKCTVSDTGHGLSHAELNNLFQAFNRLGAEHSGVEGTGIGLVITKKLLELMDSTLEVSSEPNQGSKFSFVLARTNTDTAGLPKPTMNHPVTGDTKEVSRIVLYVEDNPANMRLVEKTLEKISGLQLATAVTAEQGIELAQTHRPDLILMDINLPGMNGLEALAQLQALPATRNIPVVAVTADAMSNSVAQGLKAGFKAYITKPINIHDLKQVVVKYLPLNPRQVVNQ
ncbi:MAG: transporter substrate-binding domain-containing protein [Gammaproteobacteria bacterium]|nr:transporter substrate-binding domain-containing protein [Gammaproteobacteria bacterium]